MLILNKKLYLTLETFVLIFGLPTFVTAWGFAFWKMYPEDLSNMVVAIIGTLVLAFIVTIALTVIAILLFGSVFNMLMEDCPDVVVVVPVSDVELFGMWSSIYYPELNKRMIKHMSERRVGADTDARLRSFIKEHINPNIVERSGTGFRNTRKYIKQNEELIEWLLL